MTTTSVSIFGKAHRAFLPIGLLGLLAACGGGGGDNSKLTRSVSLSHAINSATPSVAETATILAQGADLNARELEEAQSSAEAEADPASTRKSGQVTLGVASAQLPVYRFFNTQTGSHFFTASTSERDSVQATLPNMTYEGQAFVAAAQASAGLKPVYRFHNTTSGAHFYTISSTERDLIQERLPQFNYEGIAYYASQVAGLGLTPLYRFQVPKAGSHFYTASASERQQVQDTLGSSHSYEGVGYHVLSTDCTVVNDTARQATANGCYLANNTAEVAFTLPLSADLKVGDTLRVSGLGSGGWRISQNNAQVVQAALPGAIVGAVWTPRESDRTWKSVASSADGNKLVAVVNEGRIYLSSDAGVTWTPTGEAREWSSVASSADGSKLVATVNYGQIYTSSNAGLTWTARDSARHWISVASSADGAKLIAAEAGGFIYTSLDAGATWTPGALSRNWSSVASSSDGSKLVAVVPFDAIYVSSDAGVSWTPRNTDVYTRWSSVASSADGSKLVAASLDRQIYTSTDSGQTWISRWPTLVWTGVTSSADGSKLIAVSSDGYTVTSSDSGQDWRYNWNATGWVAVAASSDGNRLVALENGKQIRTSRASTTPGSNSYLQGTTDSSIELKYLGNDAFEMLEFAGDVTVTAYFGCASIQSAPKAGAQRKC